MSTPKPTFKNYDPYIADLFAPEDEILQRTRAEMQAKGLRPIHAPGLVQSSAGCYDC